MAFKESIESLVFNLDDQNPVCLPERQKKTVETAPSCSYALGLLGN